MPLPRDGEYPYESKPDWRESFERVSVERDELAKALRECVDAFGGYYLCDEEDCEQCNILRKSKELLAKVEGEKIDNE